MRRLRSHLRITSKHGFVLSTEWLPTSHMFWRDGNVVILQVKYLEAAARLSLLKEDFEPRFFDSLCVSLHERPLQFRDLNEWLLDVCRILLDPRDDIPSFSLNDQWSTFPTIKRYFSNNNVLHPKLHPIIDDISEVMSAEDRFQYFRSKVSKLRIWHDDGHTHLKELKALAQALMETIAVRYDERYLQLSSEPRGTELISMPYDVIPASQVLRCPVTRQDHEEVSAIRVDEISRREADMQSHSRRSMAVNEDLFLAQLSLRAKLLDDSFNSKVIQVIKRHRASDGAPLQEFLRSGSGHRRTSLQSMDSSDSLLKVDLTECRFAEGVACVEVHSAPVKTIDRMREKLMEYNTPDGVWPLSANILDPVRVSIVCHGPSQILQVLHWFQDAEQENGLPLCRIKNKFAAGCDGVQNGYRDLKLFALLYDTEELRIIGEIQIHDRTFFDNKHKTHRLYKITRAQTLDKL